MTLRPSVVYVLHQARGKPAARSSFKSEEAERRGHFFRLALLNRIGADRKTKICRLRGRSASSNIFAVAQPSCHFARNDTVFGRVDGGPKSTYRPAEPHLVIGPRRGTQLYETNVAQSSARDDVPPGGFVGGLISHSPFPWDGG
jgi:hypothetical protein